MTEPEPKEVRIVIDDGVNLHEVVTGEINVTDEHQAMTDLAALLRLGAETVEAERDKTEETKTR